MTQPLPRRDAVLELLATCGRPLTSREIAARFQITEPSYGGFLRFLDSLAQEGALREVGKERYALDAVAPAPKSGKAEEREGVMKADPRGFGFVRSPGFEDDLYVTEQAMGGALHGDTVLVRPLRRSALGAEGEVVKVVRRGQHRVAGVLRRRGKSSWLEPDDARVRGPIVLSGEISGVEGDAAVALITRFPELPDENPEGKLIAALGVPGDPNVEVAKVLVRESVEELHPARAVAEAEAFGEEVTDEDAAGREDLTEVPLPTIDPEDARDHDDAVWVERAEDGTYTAWIAIADVSHYVRPGTALDAAAKARGCSIYLPDRALPMLPRALSSNLCSLLPDVRRLCLCVIARIDPAGEVMDARVVRGVMRSRAKLTYGGVARALGFTQKGPKQKAADEMVDSLRIADSLAQILRAKRMRRGALDFHLPEPKVLLDAKTGAPVGVERRAEDPGVRRAYQLVEELMLLANETMAKFLVDRGVAAIFRVHAPPDPEKIERFARLCEEVGLTFEAEDAVDPKRLSAFLRKVAKHPRAEVLNMLLLRAMKQASYEVANIGHFGLASPAYLHFTSPIRRYPDLVAHRLTKDVLDAEAGRGKLSQRDEDEASLKEAAQIASERERKAMEVEREVVDLYRALFMRAYVGETFEGTVTGMVGSGAFVSLDAPFVDVMVRADAMGKDEYELDDDQMRFVGKRSGDAIALGDRVMVTIEDVALLRRMVYAWRHAPNMADREPLRHSPFRASDERPAKPKQKRRAAATNSSRPPLPKRKGKPSSKGKPKKGKKSR